MSEKEFKHFSLTKKWIDTKSKFSSWGIFNKKDGTKHLARRFKKFIIIHWFSYIDKVDISKSLNSTLNSEEKFFFHLSFIKIIGLPFVTYNARKTKQEITLYNYKTFLIPVKSSCNSKAENFIIELNSWNKDCLSKNWKRNLKRSQRSHNYFTYKEVDLYREIDNIYEVIIKNSNLKKYKYPYSKNFLKEIIIKSADNIVGLGAYDHKQNLVAIRAFYIVDDTAIDFIAAALPESLKDYVTYNIAFSLINKAKNFSLKFYNLGGVDYKLNKGVYNFKKGLGGYLISDGQIFLGISTKVWFPTFIVKITLKFLSSLI